jgi:hypothetical protein
MHTASGALKGSHVFAESLGANYKESLVALVAATCTRLTVNNRVQSTKRNACVCMGMHACMHGDASDG